MLGADGINSLEELSFDIEILDDNFDDKVDICELVEVVIEVPKRNKLLRSLAQNGRWAALCNRLPSRLDDPVADGCVF